MTLPILLRPPSCLPEPACSLPGPVLIPTRPPGLALAALPGHGPPARPAGRPPGLWLRNAAAAIPRALAAAAATASFTAQYRWPEAARTSARHRRVRARGGDPRRRRPGLAWASRSPCAAAARCAPALNLASVGTSVFMNAIAAAPAGGTWPSGSLPPAAYALASDTLIGAVRAWAIARATARHDDAGGPIRPLRWPSSAA